MSVFFSSFTHSVLATMSSSDFGSSSDSSDSDSSSPEVFTFRTKRKDTPSKPQPKPAKNTKDKKEPAKKRKNGLAEVDFSDSSSDSSSSSSTGSLFSSTTDSDDSSTTSPEPSIQEKPEDITKRLQQEYEKNKIDIPPWKKDGPQVLVIIDTNLKSEEYNGYFARIKRNNAEVDKGRRPKKDFVMCFAMSDIEDTYDFCLKNIDVLRTYNGHPDKLRFLTNSNRASSCVGRKADPKKAGNSFVRYVREELELKDAPILVYYFSNVSCLVLRDEAHNVFCTNESQVAEPYIVYGLLPK